MKKCIPWFVLSIVLLAGCACSRDLVPDNVLEGLHKPVITKISPTAIRVNGTGFFLGVMMNTEDAQYVLYINDRKVGQVNRGEQPGYWQDSVAWMVSKETLNGLLASYPNDTTFSVRVTGINESFDISGDFEKYSDYVSEPVPLEISKGETQFTEAKQLFPEWTHSSQPIIRCDPRGNIYLAWLEKLNDVTEAFFSFSADNGVTWSQVLNISRSSESVDSIDLAADGAGHFYMTWEVRGNVESDVFFCRSLDNGATWHFPVRMDAADEHASVPSLAVDDRGGVFLAWHRWNGANIDSTVRLVVSRDLGNTWDGRNFNNHWDFNYWRPLLASRAGGSIDLLQGGSSGAGKLYVDLYSSLDYGNSWLREEVGPRDAFAHYLYPLLRFGPENRAYVVWGAGSTAGHFYSHWNYFLRRNGDGNWSSIQDLSKLCPAIDERTALSISGKSVDVVLTGPGCLFLLRSTDEGSTWPVPESVAGSEGYYASQAQDMALHPSGKTCLIFIRKTTPIDGCLYLTQFE